MFKFSKIGVTGVVLALGLGVPGVALAADCTNQSCTGLVERIYPAPSDGKVYIDPPGDSAALTCARPAGKYVTLAVNTDLGRATYQALLAAFLAGKEVTIRVNTTASECAIQYVMVDP